ncbi:UNVERIFIED_CONTAM: hypothetical protein GTU68_032808 [Idotea baltica]|nr:hypothetical protein [Idotea baltica]
MGNMKIYSNYSDMGAPQLILNTYFWEIMSTEERAQSKQFVFYWPLK